MRPTKALIELAAKAYGTKRHPARWDGEPWGEAGQNNHRAAIKEVINVVNEFYNKDKDKEIKELKRILNKVENELDQANQYIHMVLKPMVEKDKYSELFQIIRDKNLVGTMLTTDEANPSEYSSTTITFESENRNIGRGYQWIYKTDPKDGGDAIAMMCEQEKAKKLLEASIECENESYKRFMKKAKNSDSVELRFGDVLIKKYTREDILKWKSQHKDYKKGDPYDFTKI